MPWFSAGEKTNPSADDVLADTGALSAGSKLGSVIIASNAAATVAIQRRNAANDGNVNEQLVYVAASGSPVIPFPPLALASGERLRVVAKVGPTGKIQATIALL